MARDNVFSNFGGACRGNRGGGRSPREPGFGQSVLLKLASVDEESNTLSGTVIGGNRHGEEVEGVSFIGRTKPKHLLKKNAQSYIDPALIEGGNVHMIVDRLEKKDGNVTARWMRKAGEHVEYSTPDHPKWMALVPMKTPWAADDDEPEVPRYGVMTVDVGGGAAAQSIGDFREAFVAAASQRGGFGAVHMVMHGEAGRRTQIEYAPTGEQAGVPGKTPEERFASFMEGVGGEKEIAESFSKGYTITVTPLSMRTLSKFETTRLIESDNRMSGFTLPSHGWRLSSEMRRAKEEDRQKVNENFLAWAEKKGFRDVESLQSAENRVVERFAAEHGAKLPRIGNIGYLPAGYALRDADEDGRPPALVTKLVPTASPIPANFVPVIGDEKAMSRYYEAYRDAARVLLAAPGVEAAVAETAAERAAEVEAAEAAEVDETLNEFDEMLNAADFGLPENEDPGEPDPSDEERPEM